MKKLVAAVILVLSIFLLPATSACTAYAQSPNPATYTYSDYETTLRKIDGLFGELISAFGSAAQNAENNNAADVLHTLQDQFRSFGVMLAKPETLSAYTRTDKEQLSEMLELLTTELQDKLLSMRSREITRVQTTIPGKTETVTQNTARQNIPKYPVLRKIHRSEPVCGQKQGIPLLH